MAVAPISGYRVAAVGIETGGDLVLGANLEFPGTDLTTTVHAEGFVPLRVRRRGRRLRTLALGSARPCAHCRQTLAEAAGADGLQLIDLDGNRRTLDDLYPLAFRPDALGVPEDAAAVRWTGLAIDAESAPPDIAAALLEAGERAHAPYSEAPSAVGLRLVDGRIVAAGCVESVAFNPTITAAQAAMVELAAARAWGAEVAGAWLAKTAGGAVDPEPAFRSLVGAVAPTAGLRVVEWRATPV
jgi:cytidine deaminase